MINEKSLSKPSKKGLEILEKMRTVAEYLYSGKEIEFEGYTYKMDGDLNPYIVMHLYKGVDVDVDEAYPIFRNEHFWNTLIDIVEKLDDETLERIRAEVAVLRVLNR